MAQIKLRDYLQETEDAISKGHVDDALQRCQHVLSSFPDSLEAQRLLGEVYLAQGNLDEAQQTFDWVLTNDPENVIAYCDRALISEKVSDYDVALDCYQQAYELSRGNGQIRQEFNKLSSRTGQQGFMFSRAGLARLYMRGDLLTQAIQEWEAVLATNAERLDARTGLLEAYWREGLHDRVEQLAKQILQDVPNCIKALLFLALVIAPRDILQARELLRKIEALDPDLTVAQDLLADTIASQPNDPFLQLLRKPPVTIEEPLDSSMASDATIARYSSAPSWSNTIQDVEEPTAAVDWASVDTSWMQIPSLKAAQDALPTQESAAVYPPMNESLSSSGIWNAEKNNGPTNAQPAMPDFMAHLTDRPASSDIWSATPRQEEPISALNDSKQQAEPWMLLQEALNNVGEGIMPPLSEDFSHIDAASEDAPTLSWQQGAAGSLEAIGTGAGEASEGATEWSSAPKQDEMPAPPAWLNMLTQNDRRLMGGGAEPSIAQPVQGQDTPTSTPRKEPDRVSSSFDLPARSVEQSLSAPVTSSIDQDDDSLFGPEWLKSLGAASIDSSFSADSPVLPSEPTSVARKEPEPASPTAATQGSASLAQNASTSSQEKPYDDIFAQSAFLQGKTESDVMATLEDLEKDLRSQGFIPLEPNTLSAIAQDSKEDTPPHAPAAPSQDEYREPSLSSALAELGEFGNYGYQSSGSFQPPAIAGASTPAASEDQAADPFWTADLSPVPSAAPEIEQTHKRREEPAPAFASATTSPEDIASTIDAPTEVNIPAIVRPASAATSERNNRKNVTAEAIKPSSSTPRMGTHPFLDGELETTMRRPAVRLQPVPQRGVAARDSRVSSSMRDRYTDRGDAVAGGTGQMNYQERLLRGYQHQLVGDYDEAMQEYRVIIRNAPELLGEVVSNVRALLKLAPKYSAGYRVLGDAYMRQGEYLQAMEAYNKALTMAKRAKA